jgi:hypothetical protein
MIVYITIYVIKQEHDNGAHCCCYCRWFDPLNFLPTPPLLLIVCTMMYSSIYFKYFYFTLGSVREMLTAVQCR